jgi:hypothetical protein
LRSFLPSLSWWAFSQTERARRFPLLFFHLTHPLLTLHHHITHHLIAASHQFTASPIPGAENPCTATSFLLSIHHAHFRHHRKLHATRHEAQQSTAQSPNIPSAIIPALSVALSSNTIQLGQEDIGVQEEHGSHKDENWPREQAKVVLACARSIPTAPQSSSAKDHLTAIRFFTRASHT